MNIALLTIHWANNYGASLQTFASVLFLQDYGNVTLLDYRNKHTSQGMRLLRFGASPRDFLRLSKDILRFKSRSKVIDEFRRFTNNLPLSNILNTEDSFNNLNNEFDVFVCGSDQIWNPEIVSNNRSLDKRYFLDFVKEKRKISFSSSMGSYRYNDLETNMVRSLLSEFHSVSVRESDTTKYLSSLLNKDVVNTLDPTLCLSSDEWSSRLTEKNCVDYGNYILVYALKKDYILKKTVDYYRENFGLKIIAIDQDPFINYKSDIHLKSIDPLEFVRLIKNAEFIITSSFHGVCFSINFNKQFLPLIPHTGSNRIESLLSKLGIENKIIDNVEDVKNFSSIDYELVNFNLNIEREKSRNFIRSSLAI